jgi:hypothetical protein
VPSDEPGVEVEAGRGAVWLSLARLTKSFETESTHSDVRRLGTSSEERPERPSVPLPTETEALREMDDEEGILLLLSPGAKNTRAASDLLVPLESELGGVTLLLASISSNREADKGEGGMLRGWY